jgi:hypothetical protein
MELCRIIHAGELDSVPSVQCASPLRRAPRSPKVLLSPFGTDVTAEGSNDSVAHH